MDLKETLQKHGWWLRRGPDSTGKKATHLLLDGGRLHVPDGDAGSFLNEYALAVARKDSTPPALVELRTPVFKLFMDIDARLPPDAPDTFDFTPVWTTIFRAATNFFVHAPRLLVCTAPIKLEANGSKKFGAHLVWPETFARPEVALAFRDVLLPDLKSAFGGMCVNDWDDVVDACVYKANGLRMPWSVKGPGDARPYIPTAELLLDGDDGPVSTVLLPLPQGVSAVRAWVHTLSIRATLADEATALHEGIHVPEPAAASGRGGGGGGGGRERLEAYCHVLPQIDGVIPEEYKPQSFTALFRTPHSVMLRSTSTYCKNVGRHHTSSTVYFVVNRSGVAQRCFCRKDTTDGRANGTCKDYESPSITLPDAVIEAFLGTAGATAQLDSKVIGAGAEACARASLPSHKSVKLDALLSMGIKARINVRKKKKM